jgi:hypothetical protein
MMGDWLRSTRPVELTFIRADRAAMPPDAL